MNTVEPDKGFALHDALTALVDAGLVRAVLLPGAAGLSNHDPAAAVALVAGEFAGAHLDSRLLRRGELFVALPGEHTHGRRFAADWLARGGWVLTDCVAGDDPLIGAPADPAGGVLLCPEPQVALAALARAWRDRMPARIVGVTGTNGKTTTKDFLAALLAGAGPTHATAGNFNNLLGVPLTLLGLRADHRFAVVEMGASAVGEIDYLAGLVRPLVGVITNASPAHLAEFGSLSGIVAGKGELLDHLPEHGAAILNLDSPGWDTWRERARCRVVSFGREAGDHRWVWSADAAVATLHLDGIAWPVPLPGEHNAANLAAAILAARELGVADDEIRAGLQAFHGSPHRGIVLDIAGRTVLDDAYNANPGSMLAAGRALVDLSGAEGTGRTFAVLGHMAELGDDAVEIHRDTGGRLARTGLDFLLAVGAEARPLVAGFDAAGGDGNYCAAVDEAARWLANRTLPGDRILVKGSRSAAMERILPLLKTACRGDHKTQD